MREFLLIVCVHLLNAEPDLAALAKEKAPAGWENVWKLLERPTDAPTPFEERVLAVFPKDDPEKAERVLRALIRWHRSQRVTPPLVDNPWRELGARLEDRLVEVRRNLLVRESNPDGTEELLSGGSPLRDDIRALWIKRALDQFDAGDYREARLGLDRIEAEFTNHPTIESLRQKLHGKAEAMLGEAKTFRQVQDALALDPRLPGARDRLEEMRKSAQVLRVGVRRLPRMLSPGTAWSDVEKQTLPLIFEGLVRLEDQAYRPALTARLPRLTVGGFTFELRHDLYWSDGRRLTTADLRQTARLQLQSGLAESVLWREWLQVPRFEGDLLHVDLRTKLGYVDPLGLLTFPVLPEQVRGQPLARVDDPTFAREPVGSGPYALVSDSKEAGKQVTLFRANPYYVRPGRPTPGSIRTIQLQAWPERGKESPMPQLVWDVPSDQVESLKNNYVIRTLRTPRVDVLAVNSRHKTLGLEAVRRALALAIDRKQILDHHFRAASIGELVHHPANGIFPQGSWASAPASRVPENLFDQDRSRILVRGVKAQLEGAAWSLKFPDDDPRLAVGLEELAKQVEAGFASAGAKVKIQLQPLPPQDLRRAVEQHDFDLLYLSIDRGDELWRLWALFDPAGSNILGTERDAKLQSLLRKAIQHREFNSVRETMQNLHAHLHESMPIIPLWQLDIHVAIDRRLHIPRLDPLSVFSNIMEWKIDP